MVFVVFILVNSFEVSIRSIQMSASEAEFIFSNFGAFRCIKRIGFYIVKANVVKEFVIPIVLTGMR